MYIVNVRLLDDSKIFRSKFTTTFIGIHHQFGFFGNLKSIVEIFYMNMCDFNRMFGLFEFRISICISQDDFK